jgi:hypothetical protein
MNARNAKSSKRPATAIVSVPASDYWRLVDQASAFAEMEEAVRVIEEDLCDNPEPPESHSEAWGAFFRACKTLVADKAPVFSLIVEEAIRESDELARQRQAAQRRQDFWIVK